MDYSASLPTRTGRGVEKHLVSGVLDLAGPNARCVARPSTSGVHSFSRLLFISPLFSARVPPSSLICLKPASGLASTRES